MSPITDPAVRRRLTTLHAAFLAIAPTIVDAVRDVDILREREANLRGRIDDEWLAVSKPTAVSLDDLAATLAADPDAQIDADRIADAAGSPERARETDREHKTRIAVLTAAADQLPPLIEAAADRVEQLRRNAERAEIELHQECYQALVAEFRTRFAPLRADVLAPMLALARSPREGGSYLSEDSLIVIRTFEAGTTAGFDDDRLLGFTTHEREAVAVSASDEIVRLLATLSPES